MSMWVPTGSTEMGDYYVDIILKYFHPNDVYIGINCGTDHGFVEKLKRIFPNIKEVTHICA